MIEGENFEVLIVDDIKENIQVLGSILRSSGIKVSFVTKGQQAIDACLKFPPDLVLLDIAMPEMDGFDVCKILKQNPKTKSIPIIFVTALNEKKEIIRGLQLGAVDYITKPFNKIELLSRIKLHLDLKKSKDEIVEKNKKLEETTNELHELIKMRDKFFSIIAHDLKNPFNSLIGIADLLVRNAHKYPLEKIIRFSDALKESAEKGHELLENLLQWSRTQNKTINFSPQKIKVKAVIDNSIAVYTQAAKEKRITIEQNIDSDYYAFADVNMLKTVIRNLVSNAIKFTHLNGRITISVSNGKYCSKIPEIKMLQINVKDTGVGINPEFIPKLFKIDANISTKGTKNEEGTGLGLILCKEFIEKHHGCIKTESEINKGTIFSFTIPHIDDNEEVDKIKELFK